MLVEVDTDVAGLVELLAALSRINLRDAMQAPPLAADLLRRTFAPARVGFIYTRDARQRVDCADHTDRWTSYRILAERAKPDAPILADCEDLTAAYAASAVLANMGIVEVAITHPRASRLAHAYVLLNGSVLDPSVIHGMPSPPEGFYADPGTARIRIYP